MESQNQPLFRAFINEKREKEASPAVPELLNDVLDLIFNLLSNKDYMRVRATCLRFYFITDKSSHLESCGQRNFVVGK
jgi:hypothetical protein